MIRKVMTTTKSCPSSSWRIFTPRCRCLLSSEACASAAATRMDVFQAAASGNIRILEWFLDKWEPEEVNVEELLKVLLGKGSDLYG